MKWQIILVRVGLGRADAGDSDSADAVCGIGRPRQKE
jgi:hypothetical protein